MAVPTEPAKEAMVKAAMMDDLGNARLDSLPMEDRRRDDFRGRRPQKYQGQLPKAQLLGIAENLWQKAINSGMFEDDDAAAVKGLDDLGGARIYDLRTQQAKHQAMSTIPGIEKHANAMRHYQRMGLEIPPSSVLGFPPHKPAQRGNRALQNGGRVPARAGRNSMVPSHSRDTTNTPPVKQARMAQESVQCPAQAHPVNSPQETAEEPVASAPVRYSNHTHPWVNAIAKVTLDPPPKMGHFVVFYQGRTLGKWPLSAWTKHVFNDKEAIISIQGASGTIEFRLLFEDKSSALRLVFTACQVRDRGPEDVDGRLLLAQLSAAPSVPGFELDTISKEAQQQLDDLGAVDLIDFGFTGKTTTPDGPEDQAAKTNIPQQLSRAELPSMQLLSAGQTETPQDQEKSDFELLQEIDGYYTAPALGIPGEDYDSVEQRDQLCEMQAHLQFMLTGMLDMLLPARKTGQMTEDMAKTAKDIKSAIVDSYRSLPQNGQFFPKLLKSQKEKVFEEFLAEPVAQPQKPPTLNELMKKLREAKGLSDETVMDETVMTESTDDQYSFISRIKYTDDELMDLKSRAISPPAHLATLDFLPCAHNGQAIIAQSTSLATSGVAAQAPETVVPAQPVPSQALAVPAPKTPIPTSEAAGTGKAMTGLAGKDGNLPENGTVSQETETTVKPQSNHKGLASSRWASPGVSIQKKEAFTGPKF